jgi:hypothetical protein
MTTASARRTRLPGEREETRAPIQTPGMAPTRMLPVRPRTKSPNSRWPTDAEAQGNGLPEVGTHQLADADRRVEQQQANNHQRAGAHRRRTDDQPATEAQHDGPQRARRDRGQLLFWRTFGDAVAVALALAKPEVGL